MTNISIFRKKPILWGSILIFVFMVLFILPIFVDVEGGTRKNKLSWFAQLNMQKVGTSLLQYANKTENNGQFPKNLSDLIEKNYLLNEKSIVSPMDNNEYLYLSGLNIDLPHGIPILMEKTASHTYRGGTKYGLMLYGDFYFTSFYEADLNYYIVLMGKLQDILMIEKAEVLLEKLKKELERTKQPVIVNLLLWRLGKMKYKPAIDTIKKCLRFHNISNEDDVYLARSIAIQACCSLDEMDIQYDKSILQKLLQSKNYFYRKRAWSLLNKDQNLQFTPISPKHINLWLQEQKNK